MSDVSLYCACASFEGALRFGGMSWVGRVGGEHVEMCVCLCLMIIGRCWGACLCLVVSGVVCECVVCGGLEWRGEKVGVSAGDPMG